jgi:hypothetical protein
VTNDPKAPFQLNAAFAIEQWLAALASPGATASERAARWREVLDGIALGRLSIGSRTPVEDTPPWVTLDVVHGGFATGRLLAEGPLQKHEVDKLATLPEPDALSPRARLNTHYLAPAGRQELAAALQSGCFRVSVPEEAALLAAIWLLEGNDAQRVSGMIEAIAPYFDRLRFYPVPHERALTIDAGVSVAQTGEVVARLRARRQKRAVEQQREAVTIWTPLYDDMIALLLESVRGPMPSHTVDTHGKRVVHGGWPCEQLEEDFQERARALLERYFSLRMHHKLCAKPDDPREPFARVRGFLVRWLDDPSTITQGEKSVIRNILAGYVGKHGVPRSASHAQARRAQRAHAARESHKLAADAIAERLQAFPQDEGCTSVEAVLADEKPAVPEAVRRVALRCQAGTLDALFALGLIGSSEALAKLLPAHTASTLTRAIEDERLRRIYWATYTAFRRRRSLLLVNLESQVKLRELPWIEALEPWLTSDAAAAKEVLRDATKLNLRAFPQTLIPNPLVNELRALAKAAELELPLVEELAADIFMGTFSAGFTLSAKLAARLLQGTLYARYFGIDYGKVLAMHDATTELADLCRDMIGSRQESPVARNGQLIEQAQVVTTHNLGALVSALELDAKRDDFAALARRCFEWICRRNARRLTGREHLHNHKNCAYAWRQMIFYIALTDADATEDFVAWTEEKLAKLRPQAHATLAPAVRGLRFIHEGNAFDELGVSRASRSYRWLGWTQHELDR